MAKSPWYWVRAVRQAFPVGSRVYVYTSRRLGVVGVLGSGKYDNNEGEVVGIVAKPHRMSHVSEGAGGGVSNGYVVVRLDGVRRPIRFEEWEVRSLDSHGSRAEVMTVLERSRYRRQHR